MTVDQCVELGRLWYADRLSRDWEPKTRDVSSRIFGSVGLTGEFWSV